MELMQRKLRYFGETSFSLYHLCFYFSGRSDWDDERKRLIAFKNSDEFATRYFISKSINLLLTHTMDKELIIIRALNSKELLAETKTGQSLDRLGFSLAATFGCGYKPGLLVKTHLTKPVKSLTITNRQKELANVYQFKSSINFNKRKILIIDDIVTSGLTACAIMKAILSKFPLAKITIFSLAWTPTLSQQTYLKERFNQTLRLNEPELLYGATGNHLIDEDFENGKTNVSLFF